MDNTKRKYLELSPELSDGCSKTVVETAEQALVALKEFCENCEVGESCSIRIVEMTPDEFSNLPEI